MPPLIAPKKPPPRMNDKVSTSVDPGLREWLEITARRQSRTLSELVRAVLIGYRAASALQGGGSCMRATEKRPTEKRPTE